MEVKQKGNAFGHKVVLFIYKLFGYKFVAFILNFVSLYYVVFSQSTKKSLQSYYDHLDIKLTNYQFFCHIKLFSFSIFDRFVSRMKPDELTLVQDNRYVFEAMYETGGVALFSHFGAWSVASHSISDNKSKIHVVMRENTKQEINEVEKTTQRQNESSVNFIDLNKGAIAANIQIANAIMSKEIVAMMVDRISDESKTIEVKFLNDKVKINKNPFDIAKRLNVPIVATFVINIGMAKYNVNFVEVQTKDKTLEEIAQNYMKILEKMVKNNPKQWYNFYDFFKTQGINK
ncbi:lysophospholipid acyltransferase family protein [Sulfurimonas sp.]|uniref:lysophospholipid acyltransferase family protein n=1 Tax=Sulfurimonas sp. TaxID=2022749 RepID=UPI002AB29852|nr:lysophospholipid acyltransferase family protein [Sulfurimonas sp.]